MVFHKKNQETVIHSRPGQCASCRRARAGDHGQLRWTRDWIRISACARHHQRGGDNEWWCNACAILRQFPVDVTSWIGIDANVVLSEVGSAATVREHELPMRCSDSARRATVLRELASVHGHRVLGDRAEDWDFRETQQHYTFVARGCSGICDYLLAPPTAKIVLRSLTTLPNFGGLSRSDDHLPVICRVSFGGDTGSRPAPMWFVCPYDRAGWRRLNISVNSSRVCQFQHILGPQQSTWPLLRMPSERPLSWLSRNEDGEDPGERIGSAVCAHCSARPP